MISNTKTRNLKRLLPFTVHIIRLQSEEHSHVVGLSQLALNLSLNIGRHTVLSRLKRCNNPTCHSLNFRVEDGSISFVCFRTSRTSVKTLEGSSSSSSERGVAFPSSGLRYLSTSSVSWNNTFMACCGTTQLRGFEYRISGLKTQSCYMSTNDTKMFVCRSKTYQKSLPLAAMHNEPSRALPFDQLEQLRRDNFICTVGFPAMGGVDRQAHERLEKSPSIDSLIFDSYGRTTFLTL